VRLNRTNPFTEHPSVGVLHGAGPPDPARLLEGTGKRIQHPEADAP
jgi:hypothetical protein